MTFTALLCVALVYIGVKYLNSWGVLPDKVKVPLALVLGVGVIFLVGASDFAKDQEFMGRTLDTLNDGSKVICGLLIGGAAVGFDTTLKTVRNIGENDVSEMDRGQNPGTQG